MTWLRFIICLGMLTVLTSCFKDRKHYTVHDLIGTYTIDCTEKVEEPPKKTLTYQTTATVQLVDEVNSTVEIDFDDSLAMSSTGGTWSTIKEYASPAEYALRKVYGGPKTNDSISVHTYPVKENYYYIEEELSWVFKIQEDKIWISLEEKSGYYQGKYNYKCNCFGAKQ